MSGGDIRQRGGSDVPPPLSEPPDHSILLENIVDLVGRADQPSPIFAIFDKAVQEANKSKPDIAQKEATGRALLERALRGIQKIAERLTEVENKAWEYRSVERSFRKETERSRQSTPEFSRELGNTRRAYHEAIGKIWVGVNNLNLALDNVGRATEKAFQGLPEALAATEASENKTIPPLEIVQGPLEKAGLLEATLLVARMDIQVLRERLRPPVSRVDERPQTASLTIPL